MTDFDKACYKDLGSNLYQKRISCVILIIQYLQINEYKFKTKSYHGSKDFRSL